MGEPQKAPGWGVMIRIKDFGTAQCPYCHKDFLKERPNHRICGMPACVRQRNADNHERLLKRRQKR